jgi:hypothetical protein
MAPEPAHYVRQPFTPRRSRRAGLRRRTAPSDRHALIGPQSTSDRRSPQRAALQAARTGLEVTELQEARLRSVFFDIAAVVAFLRKVVWIVPGFNVDTYLPQLHQLHEQIEREGSFSAHVTRFLIEARKR